MKTWDSDNWQPRELNGEDRVALERQYDFEFGFLHGEPALDAEHEQRRTRMLVELYGNAQRDDVFRRIRELRDDSD